MLFVHTLGSIYNWQTCSSLTYNLIARFNNINPCHLVVVLWYYSSFPWNKYICLCLLERFPNWMKRYNLPVRFYSYYYTWNMLPSSLRFLKSLPCPNKCIGSISVSHAILLPFFWMKELQKKEKKVLGSAKHLLD